MRVSRLLFALTLFVLILSLCPAIAQEISAVPSATQPAVQAALSPATQPTTQPAGVPYDLTDIPAQAENTATAIEDISHSLDSDSIVDSAAEKLPDFTQDITSRLSDTTRLLTPSVSLDVLRSQQRDWSDTRNTLIESRKELANRLADLDGFSNRLSDLERAWSATAAKLHAPPTTTPSDDAAASAPAKATGEVWARVNRILADVRSTQSKVSRRKFRVTSLQDQYSVLDVRVTEVLLSLRRATERAFANLLSQDSKPIWDVVIPSAAPVSTSATTAPSTGGQNLAQQSATSLSAQFNAVRSYLKRSWGAFVRHAVLIALIASALLWIRGRVKKILETDPATIEEAVIFDRPIATAITATFLFATYIYPGAPRLLLSLLAAIILVPMALLLRRLVSPSLRPLLYGLIAFVFVGFLQPVLATIPLLSRLVFLIEMAAASAFIGWYLFQHRKLPPTPDPEDEKHSRKPHFSGKWARKALSIALRTALATTFISAVANILGYVGLAKLLSNTLVISSFIAMLLHAGVILADALVLGAMSARPLNSLRMVTTRGPLVRLWFHRLFIALAAGWWLYRTLNLLSIYDSVKDHTTDILTATYTAGAIKISLGGTLLLVIVVLASIALSRFIRFLLEEDVYPRIKLAKGIPYAVSTMVHYTVLLVGFLAAISTVYDMTQFTILASAFGIGLGFGMQNIVNNFVSGLILLFERPVRVGDIIEIGGVSATVTRIGIRASVVRQNNAAEIIIPNASLISDKVTNWTLSNRQRGLELNLKIAPNEAYPPPRILQLLCEQATANPLVSTNPPPKAVVTDMSGDAFTYQLRAWTNKYEDWTTLRSELLESLYAKLKQDGLVLK